MWVDSDVGLLLTTDSSTMQLLLKAAICLVGIAAVLTGIYSIRNRQARIWWGNEDPPHRESATLVEGLPAVLVGIAEVVTGLWFIAWALGGGN